MESNSAGGHKNLNKWLEFGYNSVCIISTFIEDSKRDDDRRKISFSEEELQQRNHYWAIVFEKLREDVGDSRKCHLLGKSNGIDG